MSIDWCQGLPALRDRGILLREPRLADAPGLFSRLTTRNVVRFLATPPDSVQGFEQFIAWVQHERLQGRHLCYAVVVGDSPDAAGLIQAREIEPGFGIAEWGFALHEAHWGTDVFLRAAEMAVDFVFRHVGAHRLEARASVKNGRGNGALQKLNAVPEGVLRSSFDNGAHKTDQVLWSLIGSDWLASHSQPTYSIEQPQTAAPESDPVGHPGQREETWTCGLPELTGNGVLLRELALGDAPTLMREFRDPEVGRYVLPPPVEMDAFSRFVDWALRERAAGRYFCYAIVPSDQEQAAGLFQVHRVDESFRSAEWGFILARRRWGSGLFDRSATLLLDHLFGQMGIRRLEARAMVENGRANGVLRRLGAVNEGRRRRSFLLGGQFHDDVMWSILDSDWKRRHVPVIGSATSTA